MIYDQATYTRPEDGVHEPLLSEKGEATVDVSAQSELPEALTRDSLTLPNPSEPEIARHYTRLSQMNWAIDTGPYPLGSCTMKYNPAFTEDVAADPNGAVHPARSDESIQGTLALMHQLQGFLAKIGGMDAVTLQPPAGAGRMRLKLTVCADHTVSCTLEQTCQDART